MRVLDRVIAALLAAALATAAAITVIEIVNTAAGRAYGILDWPALVAAMARNTWSDTGPKIFGAACAAVGAILLALAVRRRRPKLATLAPYEPGVTTFVSHRDLSRTLQDSAASVEGVTDARARLRRRRAKIKADVRPDTPAWAPQAITSAAADRLGSFDLLRQPSVQVATSSRKPRGGFAPAAEEREQP